MDMTAILTFDEKSEPIKPPKDPNMPFGIPVPSIDLALHHQFFKTLKNHSVTLDPQFLSKYCDNSYEETLSKSVNSENSNSLNSQPLYKSEKITHGKYNLESDDEDTKALLVKLENANKTTEPVKQEMKSFLPIFKKAVDEFIDQIESKNFQLLLRYAVKSEFSKLKNRMLLYYQKNKTEEMTMAAILPILHKIVNEEFLDPLSDKTNETFYNIRIKNSLYLLSQEEADASEQYVALRIMKEVEMKKHVEKASLEMGRRIFMDKEYTKFFDTQSQSQAGEGKQDQMQDFLKLLSNNTSGLQ